MNINSYVRAMGSWDLFRSAFRIYRRYFWALILIHLVLVVTKFLTDGLNHSLFFGSALRSVPGESQSGSLLPWLGAYLLLQPLVVNFTTAAAVVLVSNAVVGRQVSLSHAFQRVLSGRLAGRLLVGSLAISFPGIILIFFLFLLWVVSELFGGLGTSCFWVLGLVVVLVLLIVLVRIGFFIPVLVLEKQGVRQGFRRSFSLTRHSFWRILWQYILVFYLPYFVISTAGPLLLFFYFSGSELTGVGGDIIVGVCLAIPFLVVTTLLVPLGSLILLLLYYNARARQENYSVDNLADDLGFQPIGEAASI